VAIDIPSTDMTINDIFSDRDIYNGHLFISSEGAPSQSVANAPPSWPRPITLIRGRMPGEGIFGGLQHGTSNA
jgi:hypothetical protein